MPPGDSDRDDRPATLPLPVFLAFLRRLHEGPPQHAAAVRVALAIWQGAVQRGDIAGASDAVVMVRDAVDGLITSMTALQETGRRWSGIPAPTADDLAAAEEMAQAWEARRSGGEPPADDGASTPYPPPA
jgi:hypothetical protein